jgi:hypothetical protein
VKKEEKMTDQEIIDVVTAHQRGSAIELLNPDGQWAHTSLPLWDFAKYQYRIQPIELMVFYVNFYTDRDPSAYPTLEYAQIHVNCNCLRTIKMIESSSDVNCGLITGYINYYQGGYGTYYPDRSTAVKNTAQHCVGCVKVVESQE